MSNEAGHASLFSVCDVPSDPEGPVNDATQVSDLIGFVGGVEDIQGSVKGMRVDSVRLRFRVERGRGISSFIDNTAQPQTAQA